MDFNFWIGIAIGTVLSLATSFIANFYTDPMRRFMKGRKVIFLNRRKGKELQIYKQLVSLRVRPGTSSGITEFSKHEAD
jgi:hypothetical protein